MVAAGGIRVNDDGQECPPPARVDGLVQTASGSELLVYDTGTHHIHHLDAVTAAVWRLCDGRRSVHAIAREVSASIGAEVGVVMVRVALGKLADADLLAGTLAPALRTEVQTRRSFLRRAAKGGVVAIPAIVSITAPFADAAASALCPGHPNGRGPRNPGQCVSGSLGWQCYLDETYQNLGCCVEASAGSYVCASA